MPDMTAFPHTLLLTTADADKHTGPGALLRTIIIVGIVGSVLLAWFLLRGYGED